MNRNRITSTGINSAGITSTDTSASNSRQELLAGNPTDSGQQEFHVTYYDSDCGHARTEVFDDVAAAERFASRVVRDEDDWAVVDAVQLQEGRIAA
jgi:hypothetical protein